MGNDANQRRMNNLSSAGRVFVRVLSVQSRLLVARRDRLDGPSLGARLDTRLQPSLGLLKRRRTSVCAPEAPLSASGRPLDEILPYVPAGVVSAGVPTRQEPTETKPTKANPRFKANARGCVVCLAQARSGEASVAEV